ncbi:MAG TPA: hypothetical protein VN031_03570 [Candidatus Microsaccharimonas sp.]|nr:hypothetical protein [Candidatus Microsaccharimonas sp.]
MEGYSGEDPSAESKDDGKEKKASKAAGLGGRTFEFAKKTDAAEKLADASSIWEKLIPKEGGERPKGEPTLESFKVDKTEAGSESSVEEAEDAAIAELTEREQVEISQDYAAEKLAELEAGQAPDEDPAEAAARHANIEYLRHIMQDAEAAPIEATQEPVEVTPAEFLDDEAIDLSDKDESTSETVAPSLPFSPRATEASFGAAPAIPNLAPRSNERRDMRDEASYFFAGGVLGYLLGRRRGRIKTEKRMRAVTKRLETQISETRSGIAAQEQIIRQQARDRYNQLHPSAAETTPREPQNERATSSPRRAEVVTNPGPNVEHPVATNPERVTAEDVPQMSTREVLALAADITIEGTSLKKIYEAKQITEPGLRRLAQEHLRGGDLKRGLQKERIVKQMQYERDPQMRDRLAASYASVDAAQPQSATEGRAHLLAEPASPNTARMHQTVKQAATEAKKAKQSHTKRILIGAWTTLIVVLVVVAVMLAVR